MQCRLKAVGVVSLTMVSWDNGPQGFGDNSPPGTSTQWPSSVNMAATFDPELAGSWGAAMGEEFWGKVLLVVVKRCDDQA